MTETARRYSGQSPDERDAERRRRLLATGRELFGTIGYAGTPIERLCAEAKVSTRHFYQLYDNKEAVFLDVYETITSLSFERAVAALVETADASIAERAPYAFLEYVGPMLEDIRVARIAFIEIMGVSPRIEERRLAYRESLVEVITREGRAAVAKGEARDRDFRFATLALAGAANAIVYDWACREDRADVAELKKKLGDLALTLLVL
ncbi:MAG: transcriptional regulator, TetR family [Marmoricola sp.]|nr:transcriptional regulator, TetR family [Marmoricola sp.]